MSVVVEVRAFSFISGKSTRLEIVSNALRVVELTRLTPYTLETEP